MKEELIEGVKKYGKVFFKARFVAVLGAIAVDYNFNQVEQKTELKDEE